MTGRILRSSDYQRMPWKNGGGTTTEIWKAASPTGEMLWRLSIADVASDGPFSEFPGIDRWIMVISGNGMELTIDRMGARRLDRRFAPIIFPGDAKTECRLIDGPIRDFNFMVARGFGKGLLEIVTPPPGTTTALRNDTVAVHVLRGAAELETGNVRDLTESDTWIADGSREARVRARGDATVAVISIAPTPRVAA